VQCRRPQPAKCTAAYADVICRPICQRDCTHGPFCARCRWAIAKRVLPTCICRALIDVWRETSWPAVPVTPSDSTLDLPPPMVVGAESPASIGPVLPPSNIVGPGAVAAVTAAAAVAAEPAVSIGPALPPSSAAGPAAAAAVAAAAGAVVATTAPTNVVSPTVEAFSGSSPAQPAVEPLVPEPMTAVKSTETDQLAESGLKGLAPHFKRRWPGGDEQRPKVRARSSAGRQGLDHDTPRSIQRLDSTSALNVEAHQMPQPAVDIVHSATSTAQPSVAANVISTGRPLNVETPPVAAAISPGAVPINAPGVAATAATATAAGALGRAAAAAASAAKVALARGSGGGIGRGAPLRRRGIITAGASDDEEEEED